MIKAIVTDIEGTTSSIEFVTQQLFPYAKKALPTFLAAHHQQTEVASLMQQAATEAGIENSVAAVTEQLLAWIDDDVKATPLKTLQGLVWQTGYETGDITGHIYSDASSAIRRWSNSYKLAIYSSGSVKAQKLLFHYSDDGDLTPYLSKYFDTNIGHKREAQSYEQIASALALPAHEILFLSDVWQELEAAKHTGMNVIGLKRGVSDHPDAFIWVNDFTEVEPYLA